MNYRSLLIAFISILTFSCRMASQQNDQIHTNHLIHENSPYLLQHAHNPVNWYPWGEEALNKAKEENKMILVSIGYAACHWCHVMEHESFEDVAVAEIMNKNFVCIKVDREERPDIDDVYMSACQLASGRGCGWPLNAFALPDGRPVWAGTYFPQAQWLKVLDQFENLWQKDKEKLENYAKQITAGIRQQDEIVVGTPQKLNSKEAHNMAKSLLKNIDFDHGGSKGAPKFPMPNNYLYLLNYYGMTGDREALDAVEITLDQMANGGIYDQIGGGFARYSTDSIWLAPHFEKMLYDNGQLLSLYAKAYQVTQKDLYKKVINETVDWLEREMIDKNGGFYSSLDADSEGEEGKFYVWSEHEIDSILGDASKIFKAYYDITPEGNWEHSNILHRPKTDIEVATNLGLRISDMMESIGTSKQRLMLARDKRVRPGLDDKILTAWNALTITGLVNAYQALGDSRFLELALKNAAFVKSNLLQSDYQLYRNYKDGQVKINAFLDDYTFLSEAFVNLYQVTFDEKWLSDAVNLTDYAIEHFYDKEARLFNYTSNLDPPLIARKKEIGDNVIPGSNSAMARNLNYLGQYFPSSDYNLISDSMLYNLINPIISSGQTGFYSNWAILYLEKLLPTYEIAIVGDQVKNLTQSMQRSFLPNAIYLGGTTEGSLELLQDKLQAGNTMIYVCQNKVCQLPVTEVKNALAQIKYLND
ncbi:MAG: thioredoxin domain-containing protein [Saprospiraceae bacterium]|nr:thioredoxin domain-containing protein [Saprospiraceae bacterium]